MLRLSSLFLLFFCWHSIGAQQISSIQLSEKDGLPDIEFYNIIEDSKKFIWLAADNGLYRYNGKDYKHFTHPEQRGNAVFGVVEDTKGRVWCNNISGQFFFIEGGKIQLFKDLSKILNGQLSEFIITPTHLLVFSSGNIIEVNLDSGVFKKRFNASKQIGNVRATKNGYTYTLGNFIKQTDAYLKTIDSLKIDVFENYGLNSGLSLKVSTASNGSLDMLYFRKFNKNTFYQYSIEHNSYKKIEIPEALKARKINYVFTLNDEFWFLTDLGIFICEFKKASLILKQRLFEEDFTTKIIIDHHENYWLTTKGNGIKMMPNVNISQFDVPQDLQNISAIKKVDDSLLAIGTKKGKAALLFVNEDRFKIIDSTTAYRISEINYNPLENKLLFLREERSISYDVSSDRKSIIPISDFDGAKSLSLRADGSYVLSTYRSTELHKASFELDKPILRERSYTNYVDYETGLIYVGSVNGLFYVDRVFDPQEIRHENKSLYVNSIAKTSSGTIWIGTFKDGIYALKDNRVIKHFSNEDGLLSNKVTALKSDNHYLWITTEKGIQKLDVSNFTFYNLTKRNGIPSYRISGMVNLEETMVFASNNGLFQVHKQKAFKPQIIPEIYLTDILINSKSVEIKDQYNLDFNQNNIEIGFNSNGFESYFNNRYAYRFTGEKKSWTITEQPTNTVKFNNLPGGNYQFQIAPYVSGEIIETKMRSLDIVIESPFWEQWWFYLLLILLAVSTIYLVFKRQINKLKRKQAEEIEREKVNQKLVWSKLENLRSQMNPHFIFNALNSIQEYIVLNEKDLASSFLIKFSRLIRIYLEHSRKNEISLKEELKALNIYLELEKDRFEDVLSYEISVSDEVNVSEVKVPSLFIQPYVENALKHGLLHKKEDRRLTVSFDMDRQINTLICRIADNGVGVEASMKINKSRNPIHKSFATNAIKERVSLLNLNRSRKISVEIADISIGGGTEVIIKIPNETNL